MTVWSHLPTILKQRLTLPKAGLVALCVAFITTLFFAYSSHAAAGINKTISFQGRLQSAAGAIVPDGYYNVEFKLYQDGDGSTAGNTGGTLKWSESYVNNGGTSGVQVKNGYFSVNLGSNTPFGSSVDWNQDTLWLSMNIAGSATNCTTFNTGACIADGEMLPMKRINAVPYALNAGTVGGKSVDELIHNGTTAQNADFNITGTGTANILQGNTSVIAPLFDSTSSGELGIGTTNATSITIGSANTDQTISIGSGDGNKTLTLGSSYGTSTTTIQGGSGGVAISSVGDLALGTSSGDINLTTSSGGNVNIKDSNGSAVMTISDDGTISTSAGTSLSVGGSASFAGDVSIQGSTSAATFLASDSSTASDVKFQASLNGTTKASILADGTISGTQLHTSSIDTSSNVTLSIGTTNATNVQIGNGTADSSTTLLTLDKAASAPDVSGNSNAMLGSMYYDTTLGKVQCYEAAGWGDCGTSPDIFVTLSPEYANAVMNGADIGTITSDFCSDSLNINDGSSSQPTICGTNETYNFYKWNSSESTDQTRSIYVTYQLPSNFKKFVAGSTSLMGRTDSTNSGVKYKIYQDHGSGLVACGSDISVSSGSQTSWQKASASGGNDPSGCNFQAGDSVLFRIDLTAKSDANAYVSNLNFAFSTN